MSDFPKRRKLGLRIKKQEAREWGWTVPVYESAELFDVETGEAFDGIGDIQLAFHSDNPEMTLARMAEFPPYLVATVQVFIAKIE